MWPDSWKIFDRWLFGPSPGDSRLIAVVLRICRYPYAVIRDLLGGEINLRAMGLVYATLLSSIPLLASAFAILKGFGPHRYLEPVIFEFFRPLGAGAAELTARVMHIADAVSGGLVGVIGFALLLWTLVGTIRKVEDSFNFLWRVEVPRGLARRVAEYAALIVLGPALLVAFLTLSSAALHSTPVQYVARLPLADRLFELGLTLSPYVTVTAIFTLLYLFVPNTRVRWRPALIGALAAGVLWAAVGRMFTTLFVASTRLLMVYASFAIVVAALLWTYFGWLILLAGARLAFYVQNPQSLRFGLEEVQLSGEDRERLALGIMVLTGRSLAGRSLAGRSLADGNLADGRTGWTVDSLATAFGLPGIAVSGVVHALEDAGLLRRARRGTLTPARAVACIPLAEIVAVARRYRSGHSAAREPDLPAVARLGERLEACWRDACAGRTLGDLIDEPG